MNPRPILVLLIVAIAPLLVAAAPAKPMRLQFEANLARPFPFLSRLGSVDIRVYPQGVSADSIWLDAFARSGARDITVKNPFGRMYTDLPVREIAPILSKLSGSNAELADVPTLASSTKGTVKGIAATRYRVQYGPEAWVDVWMTTAVPTSAQFRTIAFEFIRGVAPGASTLMNRLPGMPVYIELNFRRFKKVPILRLESIDGDMSEAEGDLSVGSLYFRAPFIESLWK